MRKKSFILALFILASCTTQRFATLPKLTLSPLNKAVSLADNNEVKVDFTGLKSKNYEFEVSVKNNSKDTISIDPALFYYSVNPVKEGMTPKLIYSINPEKRIEQLEMQKDSLMSEKNPYSLNGKSVKQLVQEGLITGTISVLTGTKTKDLEAQRQQDEDDWNENHSYQLKMVMNELDFWNKSALLSCTIPPDSQVRGKVLFPVSVSAKEIQVEIPVQKKALNFTFAQSN
ncbi:MAG: hypothetical protein IH595_13250 [Bacteroidales bacterium]|nr:hypothetical protein [Bacteroidales bacterium]